MRDMILGLAIVISGVAVAWALTRDPDRSRYAMASAADAVMVLDTHTGQLQTFVKPADSKFYVYAGADSRRLALERQTPLGR